MNSAVAGLAEQWRGLQRLYVVAFLSATNADLINSVILGLIIYCSIMVVGSSPVPG
jgi:hypothetical protein